MSALVNLQHARESLGMSQAAAAAIIGKTQSHYGKIERGQVSLNAQDALTLCQFFNLNLESLLVTC